MGDDEPEPTQRFVVDYEVEDVEAFPCSLEDVIAFSRVDVYRQRIFGCYSGRAAFMATDNQRRDTCFTFTHYLMYLCFLVLFITSRFHIEKAFDIKQAISTELHSIPFQIDPVRRTWKDVLTPDDVDAWLRNAFPEFIAGQVQESNHLVTGVNITIQSIKDMATPFERFAAFSPKVWIDQVDHLQETVIDELSLNENTFGAYRDWTGAELNWSQADNSRCIGEEIDMLEFPWTAANSLDAVVGRCKDWCEELQAPSTCRCWTLENAYTCRFYAVAIASLRGFDDVGRCGYRDVYRVAERDVMRFPSCSADSTASAYWPTIKQFKYQQARLPHAAPGHVVELLLADDNVTGDLQQLYAKVRVAKQVADFLDGEMLAWNTAKVLIEFCVYNPNFQEHVFTWLSLTFQLSSFGAVRADHYESTLVFPKDEAHGEGDAGFADVVLIVLLIWHTGIEIRSNWQNGWAYWTERSTCCRGICFIMSWAFLKLYVVYRCFANYFEVEIANNFEAEIEAVNSTRRVFPFEAFEAQVNFYQWVNAAAGFAAMLAWMMVLSFLVRLITSVAVLVRAVVQTLAMSFYVIMIALTLYGAFSGGAHFWFGRHVKWFSTFRISVTTWAHMIFGKSEKFEELVEHFPNLSFFCMVSFSVCFVFLIPMFYRALIMTAYDDFKSVAVRDLDLKQRRLKRSLERESQTRNSTMMHYKVVKALRAAYFHWYKKVIEAQVKAMRTAGEQARLARAAPKRSGRSFAIFSIYTMAFHLLARMMLQPGDSVRMRQTVLEAVRTPTFEVQRDTLGLADRRSFDDIESWEDVRCFLEQALPKIMFNSSAGQLYGGQNPLFIYAPQQGGTGRQLVLNDWNIFVGQQPVRLTMRFVKEAPLHHHLVDFISGPDLVFREAFRFPDDGIFVDYGDSEAVEVSEIVNNRTRIFLGEHCHDTSSVQAISTATVGGWACMLGVNASETMAVLSNIRTSGVVGPQTGEIVVDFVTYNGNLAMFLHAAIRFVFSPSGVVKKQIDTAPIKPDAGDGPHFSAYFQAFLTIVVGVMTLGYLFASVFHFCKATVQHHGDDVADMVWYNRWFVKLGAYFKAVFLFACLEPLELWTFVSSYFVMHCLVLDRVELVGSPVSDFFFKETPSWNQEVCERLGTEWCSDEEILAYMAKESLSVKRLSTLCGISVLMFPVRALGILKEIPQIGVMWRAMFRTGLKDICCLLLVIVFAFEGFVFCGHHFLGHHAEEFHTLTRSHYFCFEMFSGSFNFGAIEQLSTVWSWLYILAFMFFFRLTLYNLFLAIVDRSVRTEQALLDKWLKQQTGAAGTNELSWWERVQKTLWFNPVSDADVLPEGPAHGLLGLLGDPAQDKFQEEEDALEEKEAQSMAEHVLGASECLGWLLDAKDASGSTDAANQMLHRISRASARVASIQEVDSSPTSPLSSAEATFSVRPSRTWRKRQLAEEQSGAFAASQESSAALEMHYREQVLGDRSVHSISNAIIPESHAWHLLPTEVKTWAIHLSQDVDAFISVACAGRTQKKEVVPGELSNILKRGEVLIKSRAVQQSARVDQAIRETNGGILQRLADLQSDRDHFAWYIMIREKELRKLQKMHDQSLTERGQIADATARLLEGPLAGGGPSGPAGDVSAPPGSLSIVPEGTRPDPSLWKAAAVRAALREADQMV